jgi:hypothetical protein
MTVKVLEFTQSLDVDNVLEEFDHPKQRKRPEDKCSSIGYSVMSGCFRPTATLIVHEG